MILKECQIKPDPSGSGEKNMLIIIKADGSGEQQALRGEMISGPITLRRGEADTDTGEIRLVFSVPQAPKPREEKPPAESEGTPLIVTEKSIIPEEPEDPRIPAEPPTPPEPPVPPELPTPAEPPFPADPWSVPIVIGGNKLVITGEDGSQTVPSDKEFLEMHRLPVSPTRFPAAGSGEAVAEAAEKGLGSKWLGKWR